MSTLIIYCLFSYAFVGSFTYNIKIINETDNERRGRFFSFFLSPLTFPILFASSLAGLWNVNQPK